MSIIFLNAPEEERSVRCSMRTNSHIAMDVRNTEMFVVFSLPSGTTTCLNILTIIRSRDATKSKPRILRESVLENAFAAWNSAGVFVENTCPQLRLITLDLQDVSSVHAKGTSSARSRKPKNLEDSADVKSETTSSTFTNRGFRTSHIIERKFHKGFQFPRTTELNFESWTTSTIR